MTTTTHTLFPVPSTFDLTTINTTIQHQNTAEHYDSPEEENHEADPAATRKYDPLGDLSTLKKYESRISTLEWRSKRLERVRKALSRMDERIGVRAKGAE